MIKAEIDAIEREVKAAQKDINIAAVHPDEVETVQDLVDHATALIPAARAALAVQEYLETDKLKKHRREFLGANVMRVVFAPSWTKNDRRIRRTNRASQALRQVSNGTFRGS